jgi:hypothetical protein
MLRRDAPLCFQEKEEPAPGHSPRRCVILRSNCISGESVGSALLVLLPTGSLTPATASGDLREATYVLDLLSDEHARALLTEAHRLLAPSGLLCLAGLTEGVTPAGRVVSRAWGALAQRWPALLGGCRPIELEGLLAPDSWRVERREVITSWGVPTEVVVAAVRESGENDG